MALSEQARKEYWQELNLLQGVINKFDDITFKIKSWFITIFVAVIGYSIAQSKPGLLILNIFFIGMFYFYEVTYRISHGAFLKRFRDVEAALRENREMTSDEQPPNLDWHLFQTQEVKPDSRLFNFFSASRDKGNTRRKECFGIERDL